MSRTEAQNELGRWSAVLYVGLLVLAVWAPLPFGSVEPWAVGLLRVGAIALATVWALGCAARGTLVLGASPLQLCLFAAAGLAFVQSVALPGFGTMSVDPYASRNAAATLLTFAVLFSAALVALDRPHRLQRTAAVLFVVGFALSVLGVLQSAAGVGAIYGLRQTGTTFFGPFANKNHFAGLMEVLLPLGLGPLVAGSVRRERRGLVVFAAVLICVALVLSRSRGGLFSLCAEIAFLVLVAVSVRPSHGHSRWRTAGVGVLGGVTLAACVAFGVLWVGSDDVVASLADLPDTATSDTALSRNGIWNDSARLIGERPLLGSGVGAYGVAFSAVTSGSGGAVVHHAHNDFLQVLVDAGASGGLIAILFGVGLGIAVARSARNRDPILRGIALGASTGCFGLLVHSLIDFNLQIPSNALAFLVSVALVVRAAALGGASERSGAEEVAT